MRIKRVEGSDPGSFGHALFAALIHETGLAPVWSTICSRQRPVSLSVEFGEGCEEVARLPLELLHDNQRHVFALPGSGLRRSYTDAGAREFRCPQQPRVLFAWAKPEGAGDDFDPQPHIDELQEIFDDRLSVLERATLKKVEEHLEEARKAGEGYDFLHILAHGYPGHLSSGLCLHGERGGLAYVDAQQFAQAVRKGGSRLTFLCSCQTAVARGPAFSGVGQQLLLPLGGDQDLVVATQANLPVPGSAQLAGQFYRHLLTGSKSPAQALARARVEAFNQGRPAWSVPVLLSRADLWAAPKEEQPSRLARVPRRIKTFLERPDPLAEILQALEENRLVTVLGLPGIGKTELGKEAARQIEQQRKRQALFHEAQPGMTVSQLRTQIGLGLGQTEVKEDSHLAALLSRRPCLLLIDNAEDLMREDASQTAFRHFINALLRESERLRILLTSRWPVGNTEDPERTIDVRSLSRQETSQLLIRELTGRRALRPQWPGSPEWEKLLGFLDGHPRSLRLVSMHFEGPGASLSKVVERLEALKADAIIEPSLIGRRDAFEALSKDSQARLRSLVASIDLSFEYLEEHYPESAQGFLRLSFFPSGLPEAVAQQLCGGPASMALEHLFRYRLVEWEDGRATYPVPLHWYAEQRRSQTGLDTEEVRHSSLEPFAAYLEACDAQILAGDDAAGTARIIAELANLSMLPGTEEVNPGQPSALARIASAVSNGLSLADQFEAHRSLLESGLLAARKAGDSAGQANCLKSRGDLKVRLADLQGARSDYDAALPLFEAVQDRLGQANCLKSRGDLKVRLADLQGARSDYDAALPLFEAVQDRLGQANCLQSLALLELREQRPRAAFQGLCRLLQVWRSLSHALGIQSTFGYLARTAAALGLVDQALALSEESLRVGRQIRDALGQTINLGLQIELMGASQQEEALLAAVLVHQSVAESMPDRSGVRDYSEALEAVRKDIGEEQWEELVQNAEDIRSAAVEEARQRFLKEGRDLLSLPEEEE